MGPIDYGMLAKMLMDQMQPIAYDPYRGKKGINEIVGTEGARGAVGGGGPTQGLKPVGRLRNRIIAPAIKMKDGTVVSNNGNRSMHHVDLWDKAEAAGKAVHDSGWLNLQTGKFMTSDEARQLMDNRANTIRDYLDIRARRR